MPVDQSRPETPVPPPVIGDPPQWADGGMATDEDIRWSELDEVKRGNDRRWLRVYGWVVVAITVTFTFIFLSSLLVWAAHYLLPEKCLWLTDAQIAKVQSVLFSGGMGAVISSVIKRQFDKLRL